MNAYMNGEQMPTARQGVLLLFLQIYDVFG